VSADGRLLSATAAFICAVGAAARTTAEEASNAAVAMNRTVDFIIRLPK
jgi:hypothetical protein